MPELPEVEAYLVALRARVQGRVLRGLRLASPFFLRSIDPSPTEFVPTGIEGLSRLGKRIVFECEQECFAVVHLMVAGRLRWKDAGAAIPRRGGLAAFDFECGTLLVTEAGSTHRASLHLVRGRAALAEHDPGGIEPLECTPAELRARLEEAPHTLKRALTSPRLVSGVGNWSSDEILWAAQLSPFRRPRDLDDEEWQRLWIALRETLSEWRERYVTAAGERFPDKVSAFHPRMAVHGRYGRPCPRCKAPVRRVVFAGKSEMNYCAACQTGGRILADRALSRLLRDDWPRHIEDLETGGNR